MRDGNLFAALTVDATRVLSWNPPFPLLFLGLGVDVLALTQLVVAPETFVVNAIETGIPIVLTLGVYYSAVHVVKSDRPAEMQPRVVFIGLLCMAVAAGTVALIAVTQLEEGRPISDVPFALAISLAAGAAVGSPVGIYYDEAIEARRELTREVARTRELNQQLQVVNRVLRHNVRNRLTVVIGSVEDAMQHVEDESARKRLETARQAIDDLYEHTEKLRRLERLHGDEDSLVTVDLASLAESVCADVRNANPAVDVAVETPEHAEARAHPLIDAAIREAIQNAIQHNGRDGLVVTLRVERTETNVIVEIADTGTGIPERELHTLQLDSESSLEHGSGVGLWFMKWVLESSGGTLTIEGNDPTGTVVRMTLRRPVS